MPTMWLSAKERRQIRPPVLPEWVRGRERGAIERKP